MAKPPKGPIEKNPADLLRFLEETIREMVEEYGKRHGIEHALELRQRVLAAEQEAAALRREVEELRAIMDHAGKALLQEKL